MITTSWWLELEQVARTAIAMHHDGGYTMRVPVFERLERLLDEGHVRFVEIPAMYLDEGEVGA